MKALEWIKARLPERSTWKGAIAVTTWVTCLILIWRYPALAITIASGGQIANGMINIGTKEAPLSLPPTKPQPNDL